MNNQMAVELLTKASSHLCHENPDMPLRGTKFACIALLSAVQSYKCPEWEIASKTQKALQEEIEDDILDGKSTLDTFLANKFGFDKVCGVPLSITQPIRRAILSKLLAKYTKLAKQDEIIASEAGIKVRTMLKVQENHINPPRPDHPFICNLVKNLTKDAEGEVPEFALSIVDDIDNYIDGHIAMESYLGYPQGEEGEKQVRDARTVMIAFLIAKYKAEIGIYE